MTKASPVFCPDPPRAMADQRLSALDIRVLMAISFHDRFSKNGIGCTAGHGRLASLVGCHLKSLSRSIKTLAVCGYVGGRANPLNPRSRCYFVIYNVMDELITKTVKGNQSVTYTGNEFATNDASIGNHLVPEIEPIGNRVSENAERNQEDASYNILGETYNKSRETISIDPVETASSTQDSWKKRGNERASSTSVGAMLAMVERGFKDGGNTNLRQWHDWLAGLVGEHASIDNNDPNYGRAYRLFEEIGSVLNVGDAA